MTKPMISLVVAAAKNGVIGRAGAMPWYLPADLKHFKTLTLGKPCLMGRKTFESILKSLGKPLPGRDNIVVSRQADYRPQGAIVCADLGAAIMEAGDAEEIMVIGGGEIYRQALPHAARIYLTQIDAEPEGDTYFDYDRAAWQLIDQVCHRAEKGRPAFSFAILERRS